MIQFQGDATQNEKEPLPDGDYFLTVTDAEEKKSKNPPYRDMIELELHVAVGPFANTKRGRVKHWLTFIEAGSDGHGMTLHALHAFGFQHEGQIRLTAQEFMGRTIKASLKAEEYKGRMNSKIVEFYILSDHQMAAEGGALAQETEAAPAETTPDAAPAKPAPQPSAAAVAVFGKPKAKLPWNKK